MTGLPESLRLPRKPPGSAQAGLGVTARDIHAKRRQMHRIGGAQPLVMRIGIANELRRQRIEKRRARRGLNMFVHGDLNQLLRWNARKFERIGVVLGATGCHPDH